jgi:hypothetical protein
MLRLISKLIWITVFATAMGFLESAVVVYLREIYYPEGFAFPLKLTVGTIALTEVLREAATMIMLLSVAAIVSKRAIERFAYFIFAFAVWDIFYYVFLWLLIGWPQSLLTWDILFLIPLLWTGPVIAPVINSLTMIVMAIFILYSSLRNELFRLKFIEWFFILAGSFITIYAYCENYVHYMTLKYPFSDLFRIHHSGEEVKYWMQFIPGRFDWIIFFFGEALFVVTLVLILKRTLKRVS